MDLFIYEKSPYVKIPKDLIDRYTLNNLIPIIYSYRDNSVSKKIIWNDKCIETHLKNYSRDSLKKSIKNKKKDANIYYRHIASMLYTIYDEFDITNKECAVIGSITPWVEITLLHTNNIPTTIEYNIPKTSKIKCESYWDFEKNDKMYDTIVTYSSVEHSGLGRYGDPLDPDGDIKTMKTIHKHLKKDGLLIWGAPVGRDCLVWNAHRIYGKHRLPLLFDGFQEIKWFGGDKEKLFNKPIGLLCQPIVVLRKL